MRLIVNEDFDISSEIDKLSTEELHDLANEEAYFIQRALVDSPKADLYVLRKLSNSDIDEIRYKANERLLWAEDE